MFGLEPNHRATSHSPRGSLPATPHSQLLLLSLQPLLSLSLSLQWRTMRSLALPLLNEVSLLFRSLLDCKESSLLMLRGQRLAADEGFLVGGEEFDLGAHDCSGCGSSLALSFY